MAVDRNVPPPCRFFLDAQPQEFVLSVEDQQRMNQRAQRFSKGVEGNKNFKKKLSINELVKPLVWQHCSHVMLDNTPHLSLLWMICLLFLSPSVSQGPSGFGEEGEINWQDFAIEGTSSALEKMYLRLTSVRCPVPSCTLCAYRTLQHVPLTQQCSIVVCSNWSIASL